MNQAQLLVYFENSVGRILEHPDGYAVIQYHGGARQLDHLQAFLMHTGRLLRQRGWHRILADQTQMLAFTEEESHWILDYWLSQNEQRPDKLYGAVILSHDAFASLSVSQIMHEAQAAALTYRLFEDETGAQAWLRTLQ